MKQGRAHCYRGQDFEREYHFLNVIGVGDYEPRCAVYAFSKKSVNNHTDKQEHSEAGFVLSSTRTPAGFEYFGKDKRINREHDDRIEERPGQPQDGAAVAPDHFAFRHLRDELAVTPLASE